jgi:hypothetical protein
VPSGISNRELCPSNARVLLYRAPINPFRLLAWWLLYSASLPLLLLFFTLLTLVTGRGAALREELLPQFPWGVFWLSCAGIGLLLSALAWAETRRNNALWKRFFGMDSLQVFRSKGFVEDRYGLHGFWRGIPVSLHYERETLGDFARLSAYVHVSDEVETLRELGRKHGKAWFFRPDEVEHLIDPPFEQTPWKQHLDALFDLVGREGFAAQKEHPWLPSRRTIAAAQQTMS